MAATNQATNAAAEVALTEGINRLNLGPAVHVAPEQAAKRSKKNKNKKKKKQNKGDITPKQKTEEELAKELAAEREAGIKNVLSFFVRYQSMSKTEAYQLFSKDLGVEVGPSPTKFFVNICDFVAAMQAETTVHRFATRNQLRKYSKATDKFFPLKRAKEDTLLRELLIEMNPTYLRQKV